MAKKKTSKPRKAATKKAPSTRMEARARVGSPEAARSREKRVQVPPPHLLASPPPAGRFEPAGGVHKEKPAKKSAAKKAAFPDATGQKVANAGQFKAGAEWRGNAAGRPKGSRNKLCSRFIEDLQTVWLMAAADDETAIENLTKGQRALLAVADAQPAAFIKAVGNLVPKEFDLGDKTQAGFRAFLEALRGGKFKPRAFDPGEDDDV